MGAEESRNTGRVVLTDFSKAFDLVDHTILIHKIILMGVRKNIIPWICDFLHNRQQCVRFNNKLSDYLQLTAGVPQGTKLDPIGISNSHQRRCLRCAEYWMLMILPLSKHYRIYSINNFSGWAQLMALILTLRNA